MCNAWQRRQLTDIFITKMNYREETRNVGGVSVTTIEIETDFGRLGVMLNRHMPASTVSVVNVERCGLTVPGSPTVLSRVSYSPRRRLQLGRPASDWQG